ncbi:hypothetical protein D3C72_2156040 [compost metagenome]
MPVAVGQHGERRLAIALPQGHAGGQQPLRGSGIDQPAHVDDVAHVAVQSEEGQARHDGLAHLG